MCLLKVTGSAASGAKKSETANHEIADFSGMRLRRAVDPGFLQAPALRLRIQLADDLPFSGPLRRSLQPEVRRCQQHMRLDVAWLGGNHAFQQRRCLFEFFPPAGQASQLEEYIGVVRLEDAG